MLAAALLAAGAAGAVVRHDLRTDGVPVHLMEPGQLEAEFAPGLVTFSTTIQPPYSLLKVGHPLQIRGCYLKGSRGSRGSERTRPRTAFRTPDTLSGLTKTPLKTLLHGTP